MLIEINYLGCELVAGVAARYVSGRADMIEDPFADHNIFVLQWCIDRSEMISGHGEHPQEDASVSTIEPERRMKAPTPVCMVTRSPRLTYGVVELCFTLFI